MGVLGGLQVLRAHSDWENFEDLNLVKNLLHCVNPWGCGKSRCCSKKNKEKEDLKVAKSDNEDVINGVDVYVTTAYFVDPSIICDAGRSQKAFDKEGTGYALFFQNGPTPDDIEASPLTAEEAKKNEEWYGYGCVENMGQHWIKLDPNNKEPRCDEGFPAFLLFEHGEDSSLVGFVWSHVAWYTNFRNEHARSIGFSYIFDTVPQCVNDLSMDPGMTSLHVYFKDYHQYC